MAEKALIDKIESFKLSFFRQSLNPTKEISIFRPFIKISISIYQCQYLCRSLYDIYILKKFCLRIRIWSEASNSIPQSFISMHSSILVIRYIYKLHYAKDYVNLYTRCRRLFRYKQFETMIVLRSLCHKGSVPVLF